jgi:hypothetical protein
MADDVEAGPTVD